MEAFVTASAGIAISAFITALTRLAIRAAVAVRTIRAAAAVRAVPAVYQRLLPIQRFLLGVHGAAPAIARLVVLPVLYSSDLNLV